MFIPVNLHSFSSRVCLWKNQSATVHLLNQDSGHEYPELGGIEGDMFQLQRVWEFSFRFFDALASGCAALSTVALCSPLTTENLGK